MGSYGAFIGEATRLAAILRNDPVLWAQYTQQPIKGTAMYRVTLEKTLRTRVYIRAPNVEVAIRGALLEESLGSYDKYEWKPRSVHVQDIETDPMRGKND